eukprot:g11785.t1
MARIARTYRKYWPTDAVLKGKVVLEDLILCSFSTKELTEGWAVATDQRWGGKSAATVSWKPWERLTGAERTDSASPGAGAGAGAGALDAQPWKLYEGSPHTAAPRGVLQSEGTPTGDEEAGPPLDDGGFLCFSGELSPEKAARARVGGFCGTRSPRRENPLVVPDGYKSVEMRIRSDGRQYEVNFEPYSGILNDLYQGYVRTPPGQWSTVTLPLNRLLLTGQGQIRDVQRKWDRGMELRSFGFTIADGVGGPFRLDVAWVSLVSEGEDDDGTGNGGGDLSRKKPAPPTNGRSANPMVEQAWMPDRGWAPERVTWSFGHCEHHQITSCRRLLASRVRPPASTTATRTGSSRINRRGPRGHSRLLRPAIVMDLEPDTIESVCEGPLSSLVRPRKLMFHLICGGKILGQGGRRLPGPDHALRTLRHPFPQVSGAVVKPGNAILSVPQLAHHTRLRRSDQHLPSAPISGTICSVFPRVRAAPRLHGAGAVPAVLLLREHDVCRRPCHGRYITRVVIISRDRMSTEEVDEQGIDAEEIKQAKKSRTRRCLQTPLGLKRTMYDLFSPAQDRQGLDSHKVMCYFARSNGLGDMTAQSG